MAVHEQGEVHERSSIALKKMTRLSCYRFKLIKREFFASYVLMQT